MRSTELTKILAPTLGVASLVVASMLLRNQVLRRKPPTLAEVQEAIDLGNDRYVDSLCNADAEGYANLFLPDGMSLPSQGSILRGRDAIRDNIAATFRKLRYVDGDMQTIETLLADDTAYEIGRYEFETERNGRRKVEVIRGRYIVVWQRQDGEWKIAIDAGQAGAPV
jgi:uncharacterized protein (TIGR02246 family)